MRYVYVERPKPADFFRASGIKIRAEHIAVHDACHIHGIVGPFGGSASLQFGVFISDAGTHHDAATRHHHAEIPSVGRFQSHQHRAMNGTPNDDNMSFIETQLRFVTKQKSSARLFQRGLEMTFQWWS
jgi:hypothetical protein